MKSFTTKNDPLVVAATSVLSEDVESTVKARGFKKQADGNYKHKSGHVIKIHDNGNFTHQAPGERLHVFNKSVIKDVLDNHDLKEEVELEEGVYKKTTAKMDKAKAVEKAQKIRRLLGSNPGFAQVNADGEKAFLIIKADSSSKDAIEKILAEDVIDLDESAKPIPSATDNLKGIIHNNATITLGAASVAQLTASKEWYLERVGHLKTSEKPPTVGLARYKKNLGLIQAVLGSRIGKKNEEVEIEEAVDKDALNKKWSALNARLARLDSGKAPAPTEKAKIKAQMLEIQKKLKDIDESVIEDTEYFFEDLDNTVELYIETLLDEELSASDKEKLRKAGESVKKKIAATKGNISGTQDHIAKNAKASAATSAYAELRSKLAAKLHGEHGVKKDVADSRTNLKTLAHHTAQGNQRPWHDKDKKAAKKSIQTNLSKLKEDYPDLVNHICEYADLNEATAHTPPDLLAITTKTDFTYQAAEWAYAIALFNKKDEELARRSAAAFLNGLKALDAGIQFASDVAIALKKAAAMKK